MILLHSTATYTLSGCVDECQPLRSGPAAAVAVAAPDSAGQPAAAAVYFQKVRLLIIHSRDRHLHVRGRGLHSFTSQLNLSRVCHKKTTYTP